MSSFIPEPKFINPRWLKLWGEQFASPELTEDLMRNPRMLQRICDRMMTGVGIDPSARFEAAELAAVMAYVEDRQRLARLCGMTLQGNLLRSFVSKSDFEQISRVFPLEDLRIAVSFPEFYLPQSAFGSEFERLPEYIERTGAACLEAWKSGLDEQLGLRVHLMETDAELETEFSQIPDIGQSTALVECLGQELANSQLLHAA